MEVLVVQIRGQQRSHGSYRFTLETKGTTDWDYGAKMLQC